MATKSFTQLGRATLRRSLRVSTPAHAPVRASIARGIQRTHAGPVTSIRSLHLSMTFRQGIMPESENPPPKQTTDTIEHPKQPTEISAEEYERHADKYLEELLSKLEAEQDKRSDVDVEYSAGVLEVTVPTGSYVLNKQPPNKQIWLSSPLSGPKRFDWVVTGEGANEKEGAGSGDWIYLRDGTSLTDIIRKEIGVELLIDHEVPK